MPYHSRAVDIDGLTNIGPVFREVGKIKLGAPQPDPVPQGWHPSDLDYFRFDTQDEEAAARFREEYGEKPRRLRVYLPFRTWRENFETFQEYRTKTITHHICNGRQVFARWDPRSKRLLWEGDPGFEPGPCPFLDDTETPRDKRCKPTGFLKVVVAGLGRLGYCSLSTHSVHAIKNIAGMLQAVENMQGNRRARDLLQGIPFVLYRSKTSITRPDERSETGRARIDKWLVFLEPDVAWQNVALNAIERAALPAPDEATAEIEDELDDDHPDGDDEQPALAAPVNIRREPEPARTSTAQVEQSMRTAVERAKNVQVPASRSRNGAADRKAWDDKLGAARTMTARLNGGFDMDIPHVDDPAENAGADELQALVLQQFQRIIFGLEQKAEELELQPAPPAPDADFGTQVAYRDSLIQSIAVKLEVPNPTK